MDHKKFEHLLNALQPNMYNFAFMLTSDRDDAMDLMQDTSLKVLDNEDKYVENNNFKGWVLTIMRNLFINRYRKITRAGVVIDHSDDLYIINSGLTDAIETPEDAMSADQIHLAIDHLPDDLRIPFSMYLAGYRYAEIAESQSLPLGTVKSRIFFARKRLQSIFRN